MKRYLSFAIVGCLVMAPTAWAEPIAESVAASSQDVQQLIALVQQLNGTVQGLQATVQRLDGRVGELERENVDLRAELSRKPEPPQPQLASAQAPAAAGLPTRATPSGMQAFNPEIGVLADIVGQFSESREDGEGNDKLSAREVELVFGHPVDPYSRLDVTATFSDFEEASLEEAYITHWGLPAELEGRIGRLRPKVGKAAPLHRDSLDTVDEPLVVTQYLGAEGLSRTGAELSGFIPSPWESVTYEWTAGVMEGGVGEGGTLFGETRRRPSFYAHLKKFVECSDVTNLEGGLTYLVGSKDADSQLEVNALGLDATLIHYVTPTNKLKWQTEAYLQDRDESYTLAEDGTRTDFTKHPWGAYSLVDYRLGPRWGVGSRFDYVQPIDLAPGVLARHADMAYSGYLTFYQSEFARWRMQFRHTDYARGWDDNTVFLQGTIAIGVHKHQIQ